MGGAESVLHAGPTLEAWRGALGGQSVVVCGCGSSLVELTEPGRFVTIGVNDVGRLFDPTYLVVVNPRSQFRNDRFRYVEQSNAQCLFTQLDLGSVRPPVVRFRLGRYGGTQIDGVDALPYTQNSPYVAVCLAAYMGAARIGLIGVDLTDHHFFARTGTHPLAARLAKIDREYGALQAALSARGIELVNLSSVSRLRRLPRASPESFVPPRVVPKPALVSVPAPVAAPQPRRVFVVNYRFLSCGDVFADGLRHAAEDLGVAHDHAYWDDPALPARIERFRPDLVLVVHGRRFAQKWRGRFSGYRTAVWLLDEPYEVDDTARWSSGFDRVFVNDPNTLARHPNAHYLPVCFDPHVHRGDGAARGYPVGFVGGYNAQRERYLIALAEAGLLGYIVGGPWRSPVLRKLCISGNVPAQRTAELYRQTEIVVNVFRETHHYNARGVPAVSMNPRIYEALACGAAVVSELRAEVGEIFPELPQFDTPEALVEIVRDLLSDRDRLAALRSACTARLEGHAYSDRLAAVLDACVPASVAPANDAPVSPPPLQRAARPVRFEAFDRYPRRNLLYHVWPVRGSAWRWNVDELVRRIDLFNGQRIVALVGDERTEAPEVVQDYLAGHGCEFVVAANHAGGESATFPVMMERVASTSPDEVTFYAHAKGVKYAPQFPRNVRRWAEVQYAVLLDDWLAVKADLQRHAMTGIYKRHGRFRNHQSLGAWHYSGTYFWMRHSHVFDRNWRDVPPFYGGVEAWPGIHFAAEETGCLMLDHLGDLPYRDRFWKTKGEAEFSRWKSGVRGVKPPADLVTPAAFDGHTWPRLEQKPEEFRWLLERLLERGIESLLVIGGRGGGVEWHVARVFSEAGRRIAITTLSESEDPELAAALQDARERFGFELTCVKSRAALDTHYDAVFIDGDHSYRACSADFRLAESLRPRLVALHDIVDSDWHAAMRCCVSRLWAELVARYACEHVGAGDWGGIGLVDLERARS